MTGAVPRQLFPLGLLLWLAVTLPSLAVYPYPYPDDAWIAAPAENFRQTGQFGLPLLPDVYGSAVNYPHNGRLYSLALALVFQVAGFGLVQGRALSAAGALVAASLTFALGRRLAGPWAGLLAGTFFLFSWRMLWTGHVLRPDAWVVAGGLAVIVLYLRWRRGTAWQAGVLGLLAVLLVDLYTSAVFYTATICLLVLSDAVLAGLRNLDRAALGRLVSFGVGAAVATAYWLAVHLLPDPAQALTLLRAQVGVAQAATDPSLLGRLTAQLSLYLGDGFWRYSRLGPLEAVFLLAGVVGLAVRRRPADGRWLWLTGVFIAVYVGLFRYVGLYHLVQWLPFLQVALAATLVWLGDELARRVRRIGGPVWALGLAAPLLLAYAGGTAYLSFSSRLQVDYFGYADQLQALLPADAHVLAESSWYFALDVAAFTDDVYLDYGLDLPSRDPALALERAIALRGPVVLLVDEAVSYRMTGGETVAEGVVQGYAEAECTLLGTVTGVAYGLEQGGPAERVTRVYRCGE